VINKSRNRELADQVQQAISIGKRLKGLLGQSGLSPGQGIYIKPCKSIHSFFMRFAFDAVFIDANGIVCHLIHSMKPWRMSKYVYRAVGVLELPAGVLRESGTRVGDQLIWD
jgi:uncharacterized membrane protein (UPF0127 family)